MAASTFERRVSVPGIHVPRRWRWSLALTAATATLVALVVVAWPQGDARPTGAIERVDPATFFGELVEFAAPDLGLWAWDDAGHIGRYLDGDWYRYEELPEGRRLEAIAIRADGTIVAGTSSGLFQLQEDGWQRAPESPSGSVTVEVDPVTGIEWWSSEGRLYRWDGSDAVRLPEPPTAVVGMRYALVAGGDDSLWVSNRPWYPPEVGAGGLVRYRHDDSAWDPVRPLGGFEDIPAWVGRTADGGLWAVLVDLVEDWDGAAEAGEPFATWWPARLDGDSQRWTVYEGLPDLHPIDVAVDDHAVWIAQGMAQQESDELAGVLRFDGDAWTRYLGDELVTAVGVAGDGSVWVSKGLQPGLTQLDTSPGAGAPTGYPTRTVAPSPRPDAVVVSLGDDLTGTWAQDYAALLSEETGADVAGVTVWRRGPVDLAGLVRANDDTIASADVVLLQVDPYVVFAICEDDRTCRTREIAAYRAQLDAVLGDIIGQRAGDRSGVAIVSMGFWGGDGLEGPGFYGSRRWESSLEDMQAWFEVVREAARERQIAVVDVNAELLGADYRERMPGALVTDGIRLSPEGNAQVAHILAAQDDALGLTP